MPTSPRPVRPPNQTLQVLEAAWLPVEAAGFWAIRPLLRRMGAGDQHPVLLLPGFGTNDESTAPLRWTLRGQGYWAHSWRLGRNIGPTSRIVTGMRHRVEELHEQHGRTVTLIGQSLGGIYARTLARETPEHVRQVITLGSPYRMIEGDRSAAQPMWDRVKHLHDGDLRLQDMREQDRPPLLVPATSIYSRTDGVAPWQTCIDEVREHAENIEVRGSHVGMGAQPGRRRRGARSARASRRATGVRSPRRPVCGRGTRSRPAGTSAGRAATPLPDRACVSVVAELVKLGAGLGRLTGLAVVAAGRTAPPARQAAGALAEGRHCPSWMRWWCLLHSGIKFSRFVEPPSFHSLRWWMSQSPKRTGQSGAAQVRCMARSARR